MGRLFWSATGAVFVGVLASSCSSSSSGNPSGDAGAGGGRSSDASDGSSGATGSGGSKPGAGGSASGGAAGATSTGGSSGASPDGGACVPSCSGKACGDDGCDGSCGTCGTGLACDGAGRCVSESCTAGCTQDCTQGCFDLGECTAAGAGTLDLEPNVVTLGATLTTASAPDTGELYYRVKGTDTWWKGPDLVRIPDGRLAGSAFNLAGGTAYDVRVKAGAVVACGSATTEPETPSSTPSAELWVDAKAASGGTGTEAAPFAKIGDAIAKAGGGTDIHVRAGIYRESFTITKSGTAGHYLRLLGEPGAALHGATVPGGLTWKDEGNGVYSAPWTGDPRYVAHDGSRLYHYLSLDDLKAGLGKNAVPIAEGFFVEGGRLYVRLSASPTGAPLQIPAFNTAIQISGASFVWIEGFDVRFYGEGDYGKGIDVTEGSSNVVIRKNHVHEVPTGVWIRKGSTQVRIEDNEINQSTVFTWPWDAVKATDHENDAITLAGARGAIVARNVVHDVFNGVYAGSFDDDQNPDLAFDTDVYANRLYRIGDDGFEPEGAGVNERFWGNAVDLVHNGVSVAPITFGPTWVLRNRFTSYQESGFKVSNDTSGRVYLLHNTCYTDGTDQNGMNVSGPFENIVFRNNVIRGTYYAIESGVTVTTNDLDYDALFTTRGAPRIKWNNQRYDDLAALCEATGFECHGVGADPALDAPAEGRFGPTTNSPLIDKAVRLYGINDAFAGKAPDIGYVELGTSELPVN